MEIIGNSSRSITAQSGSAKHPGEASHSGSVAISTANAQHPVPITDVAVYSATLEACVKAEESDHTALAKTLRAWVDCSPFEGCPTGCNGRQPRRGESTCKVCAGSGFVPSA